MQNTMMIERQRDAGTQIKCCYCRRVFVPEPEYRREGKKITRITTCPHCGNGIERTFNYKRFKYWAAINDKG